MRTTLRAQALTDYLAARLPVYLEELRELCAIECPTAFKAGVNEADAGIWPSWYTTPM